MRLESGGGEDKICIRHIRWSIQSRTNFEET